MERLKRARAPLRAAVTRTCQDGEKELSEEVPDVNTLKMLCARIKDLQEKLQERDEELLSMLLDEDDNEEEMAVEHEGIETYARAIAMIQIKLENYIQKPVSRPVSPAGSSSYSTAQSASDKKRNYKLPKIELQKFDGELKNWLEWWSHYKQIHEDDDLHTSTKFHYLVQSMEKNSRASDVVKSYPKCDENYAKAVEALRDRFGREEDLIEMYVRELQRLVITTAKAKEKSSLSKLYDSLETQLRALESLGLKPEESTRFLFPMVESCLPEEALVAWQRSALYMVDDKKSEDPKSKLDLIMEFIRREVQAEEKRKLVQSGFEITSTTKEKKREERIRGYEKNGQSRYGPTAAGLFSGKAKECIFCEKPNHNSQECFRAQKMSFDEKQAKIKSSRACFICFRRGHNSKVCRDQVSCNICNKRHYTIMCQENAVQRATENDSPKNESSTSEQNTSAAQANVECQNDVLLKTVRVRISGPNYKNSKIVRLMFDDGSQKSYISRGVAQSIGSQPIRHEYMRNVLFDGSVTDYGKCAVHEVTIQSLDGNQITKIVLREKPVIGGRIPRVPNGPWISDLNRNNIWISDTVNTRGEDADIDVLIGSDYWGLVMTGEMFHMPCGLIAVNSKFGWSLSGPVPEKKCSNNGNRSISMFMAEANVSDLWSLETIGIKDKIDKASQAEHEQEVKDKFKSEISVQPDGRYVVKLPWISKNVELPDNRNIAEKRLRTATQKLTNQGNYEKYAKIFHEWEKEGIIEVKQGSSSREHFLPHRPVFKPESITTPVRPVFDASCRVGKHPSLNQCLEKGPNMLELIPSILLRFRIEKVGIIADIRKAFQMVAVAEEDRNVQKFLWWKDAGQNQLMEYRHCRVVFGMNCSPFILAAVLEYHLDNVKAEDQAVAAVLKKSMYVDNCVVSLSNEEEYEEFRDKSVAVMNDARMDLRQWETNLDQGGDRITTVLGLKWDKNEDVLFCQVNEDYKLEAEVNKRSVLSLVAKVFDPIGFLCPAMLPPKLMLQESWALKLDWDEEWSLPQKERIMQWSTELEKLSEIRISRWASRGEKGMSYQIHTFTDASQYAYAAVVFLRVQKMDQVSVQLLMAKSRLAPLCKKGKRATIPRLELMGCLVGARLYNTVVAALSFEGVDSYFWTDSTTALTWIQREEDWGTFVGNRVKEVNELTKKENWRFVPGVMNPADLPSRGCSLSELRESKWWEGPNWLYSDKDRWPNVREQVDKLEVIQEKKKSEISMTSGVVLEPKFSSYIKTVRVAAWIRRFVDNCRKRENRSLTRYLGLPEIRKAELDVIKEVQTKHYPKKPDMGKIEVYQSEDQLWHLRTRLTNLRSLECFQSPILLPNSDPIVHQLIEYVHRSNCHGGTQIVLGALRERFWIPSGRKTVGRIIRKCTVCRRQAGKSLESDPAPLPKLRVEAQYAFQTTGVDLAGPLILKNGRKVWVVLYTCSVYRGIFLDLVDSISTEDFVDSLEKFTSIVGRPSRLFSDNGTNFVGAYNLMKLLNWKKIEKSMEVKQIKWTFNPPSAPWWGG